MKRSLITAAIALAIASPAFAEVPEYTLSIKDHKFDPETLEVPANTKVKLVVKNLDKTPAEFESHDLNREKVISGGKEANIFVGPLEKGEYKFFDEFHEDTAKGTLVVK